MMIQRLITASVLAILIYLFQKMLHISHISTTVLVFFLTVTETASVLRQSLVS